jgi:hypothetical protein
MASAIRSCMLSCHPPHGLAQPMTIGSLVQSQEISVPLTALLG